jgi:hypothetical protein
VGEQRAGGELERGMSAERRRDSPGTELAHDSRHPSGSIDEDHVNRKVHERRVNHQARRDHHRGRRIEPRSIEQPLPPCRSGQRQLDRGRDRSPGPAIHQR